MAGRAGRTVYAGNLPVDVRKHEIEDLFCKYGRILEIELKNPPRLPSYCLVEFESSRDAEDAIKGRDGCNFDGYALRVELSHGGRGIQEVEVVAMVGEEPTSLGSHTVPTIECEECFSLRQRDPKCSQS